MPKRAQVSGDPMASPADETTVSPGEPKGRTGGDGDTVTRGEVEEVTTTNREERVDERAPEKDGGGEEMEEVQETGSRPNIVATVEDSMMDHIAPESAAAEKNADDDERAEMRQVPEEDAAKAQKAQKKVMRSRAAAVKAKIKSVGYVGHEGVYKGDLDSGIRHGHGKITWTGGNYYEGEFKNGLRDGHGVYQFANGRVYEGAWKCGQRSGLGVEHWPNHDRYEGDFLNGKFHGEGKLVTRAGAYEGSFKNGLREGRGVFEWKTGDMYNGLWKANFMHGHGKYVSRHDSVYDGDWQYGVKEGQGGELSEDGNKYDGEFKKNMKDGKGIIRYPNGKWREGLWSRGEHIKWIGALRIGGVKKH